MASNATPAYQPQLYAKVVTTAPVVNLGCKAVLAGTVGTVVAAGGYSAVVQFAGHRRPVTVPNAQLAPA